MPGATVTTEQRPARSTAPTKRRPADVHGILLVDKPEGMTSAAVVAVVKRALGGTKTGHLGTLDPFASGLLPLCLGEGTKIAQYLNTADKAYEGVLRLGVATDTLDRTGSVTATAEPPATDELDLVTLAAAFRGEIEQVPPAYSAIKHGGVRMYELARRGEAPTLEARRVVIHELSFSPVDAQRLRISVSCSKGTYIRSLARDVGERLGCPAMLEGLRRTAFGSFRLAQALPLAAIEAGGAGAAAAATISMADALSHLRALTLADAEGAARLRSGRQEVLDRLPPPTAHGEQARIIDADRALLAVVTERDSRWRIERVFRASAPCAP